MSNNSNSPFSEKRAPFTFKEIVTFTVFIAGGATAWATTQSGITEVKQRQAQIEARQDRIEDAIVKTGRDLEAIKTDISWIKSTLAQTGHSRNYP